MKTFERSYWLGCGLAVVVLALTLTSSAVSAEENSRTMRYTARSKEETIAWQKQVRTSLFKILKMEDLVEKGHRIPLNPKVLSTETKEKYTIQEIEINSTAKRRIKIIVTEPTGKKGDLPAVVCIHGHGGNRRIVYDPTSLYRGFATALAERGFVTISTDVGQHKVYEPERLLMGERLWDVMRCVDYLETLPSVDKSRIGCAGLSLGGEMAMWLGAMDERIAATLSSGFLTTMDHIEPPGNCPCWKFPGLRNLVDFADIYGLIAPRDLVCQNGMKEMPKSFNVPLARQALAEIKPEYAAFGQPEKVYLAVHEGGHVIDLPSLLTFFEKILAQKNKDEATSNIPAKSNKP